MDESSDDEPFLGFENDDFQVHEADAGSDIDVSSVHTSDLSDWDDRLSDFDDVNNEIDRDDGRPVQRDQFGWTAATTPINVRPFVHPTGPNLQLGEDRSPLFFFNQLFEPAMIDRLVQQTNTYATQRVRLRERGNGDRWVDTTVPK